MRLLDSRCAYCLQVAKLRIILATVTVIAATTSNATCDMTQAVITTVRITWRSYDKTGRWRTFWPSVHRDCLTKGKTKRTSTCRFWPLDFQHVVWLQASGTLRRSGASTTRLWTASAFTRLQGTRRLTHQATYQTSGRQFYRRRRRRRLSGHWRPKRPVGSGPAGGLSVRSGIKADRRSINGRRAEGRLAAGHSVLGLGISLSLCLVGDLSGVRPSFGRRSVISSPSSMNVPSTAPRHRRVLRPVTRTATMSYVRSVGHSVRLGTSASFTAVAGCAGQNARLVSGSSSFPIMHISSCE